MTEHISLTLTCGNETYPLVGLRGEEAMSELYRFELDVRCEPGTSLPDEVNAGAEATLRFMLGGERELRCIHGLIQLRKRSLEANDDGPIYRLVLVPHLHRATLVRSQRIFLGMTVVEIIAHKLELLGIDGDLVSLANLEGYPQRDFVMQYDESDYAFISRLCEHLGISFFFEQLEHVDQLVFADGAGEFSVKAQAQTIALGDHLNQPGRIYRLDVEEPMMPGSYVVYDYNYRRPDLRLVGQSGIAGGYAGGVLEYGCHLKDEAEAAALATVRAEELGCRARLYTGESSIIGLVPGGTTLLEAKDDFEEQSLMITRVIHDASSEGGEPVAYRNRFEAIETAVTFRPLRRTPRPRLPGFVTGTVQGPNGSTDAVSPHLDDQGRYTVTFHLDAVLGDPSRGGSHLVRMAQPFGGTGHGMHFPLRPGTEVMMTFANGDPDRPIIVGAVPNAHTSTPVTASNATQNRITAASGALFEISERR